MTEYLIPDYFDEFSCKCGACRSTCCEGWGITVSLDEYLRLLGVDCSKAMRNRLDVAFHMADDPSPERYAMLTPNWKGDCPLRLENGLCGLQSELGESALPLICRVYPRVARSAPVAELGLSGSCEKVVEMLLEREAPIGFIHKEMDINLPEDDALRTGSAAACYGDLRRLVILTLQDRKHRIAERMMRLGRIISSFTKAEAVGDSGGIMKLVEAGMCDLEHDTSVVAYGKWVTDAMQQVACTFSRNSQSLKDYWAKGAENLARASYAEMRREFEIKYPLWERYFEQLTVNHVFFGRFPFSDTHENMWDEYRALCAAHCVIMYLATIYTYGQEGMAPLSDVIAAAFRMIEHSDFDRRGAIMCERLGIGTQEQLDELLCAL